MAEIWKTRGRKPVSEGPINISLYLRDCEVIIQVGDHYLKMKDFEFNLMIEGFIGMLQTVSPNDREELILSWKSWNELKETPD